MPKKIADLIITTNPAPSDLIPFSHGASASDRGLPVSYFDDKIQAVDDKASLLQSQVDAFANGEGKTYKTLVEAMAVDPLPDDNTPFRIDNDSSDDGNYIYDSSDPDGYDFISDLIIRETGDLDPTNNKKVVTGSQVSNFTSDLASDITGAVGISEQGRFYNLSNSTAILDGFGFDYTKNGGMSQFRGIIYSPNGDLYCIPRSFGEFVVIDKYGNATNIGDLGIDPSTYQVSGGAITKSGIIYSPPSDMNEVLIIDTNTNTASLTDFGLTFQDVFNKFRGAVLGGDGRVYCTPATSTETLIIDPSDNSAELTDFGLTLNGNFDYVGGVYTPSGKIFCIPYRSSKCLIIDTINQTAELTDFGIDLSGSNKWTGGAFGSDGKIYGTPRDADDILVIDPVNMTAERKDFGIDLSGEGNYARSILGNDGKIYMSPQNKNTVLILNPITQTVIETNFGLDLSQTWIGGGVSRDGKLYMVPDAADSFIIIDIDAPPYSNRVLLSSLINKEP